MTTSSRSRSVPKIVAFVPRVVPAYFRPFQAFSFIEIAILRRVPLIVSFSGDGVRLVTLNDSVAPGRSASLLKF